MGRSLIETVVFIRRQSPDWRAIARDHRDGRPIAPQRFVPDHPIPGFPRAIETLVDAWNRRFVIDFFTVKAIIAGLSTACVTAVAQSVSFGLADLAAVERLAASRRFIAFFHDDDDFFAPHILSVLQPTDVFDHDTCVFPLYRVHADSFTFARDDMHPGFVLGRRQSFDFRFQSNNYGISSRVCSVATLRALKDHVFGSVFADARGLREKVFSCPISATVKTPASAMQLPALLAEPAVMDARFAGFIEQFARPAFPPGHDWLIRPLLVIARLLKSVASGDGYDAIRDLIDDA